LCNHPNLSVLAQPFPLLYVDAKQRFLRSRSIDEPNHPLSHYVGESRYSPADVTTYLEAVTFAPEDIAASLHRMAEYSGALTPYGDIDLLCRDLGTMGFSDMLSALNRRLAKPGSASFGSKEIYVEEFLPYLIEHGYRVIVVVRDPRDVIASLNYGEGRTFAGGVRPVLFQLRNWRRSLAFALADQVQERALVVRYEDVATNTTTTLDRMTKFLDQPQFEDAVFAEGIRDQNGDIWLGNSSHSDKPLVSTDSIRSYTNLLAESTVSYIEHVCGPEMEYLGYLDAQHPLGDMADALAEFREPIDIERHEFPQDYSYRSDQVELELHRAHLLRSTTRPSEQELSDNFVFPSTYDRLRSTSK